MDEFTYLEAERYNLSGDMRAPLVSKDQTVDISKLEAIKNGDKCVPASRFKLRSRQTVKCLQGTTQTSDIVQQHLHPFERIQWSSEVYSIAGAKSLLLEQRPIIVKLESGYSNENILELAHSQILLIMDYGMEKRVTGVHESGCELSFPWHYKAKIRHDSKDYTNLNDLLLYKKFPLNVEFQNQSFDSMNFQNLKLTSVKEYTYLKACTLVYGWVDQTELLILPELSLIEMRVGTGMDQASLLEWLDYKNMLQRSIRHLTFNSQQQYSGILYEKEVNIQINDNTYYNANNNNNINSETLYETICSTDLNNIYNKISFSESNYVNTSQISNSESKKETNVLYKNEINLINSDNNANNSNKIVNKTTIINNNINANDSKSPFNLNNIRVDKAIDSTTFETLRPSVKQKTTFSTNKSNIDKIAQKSSSNNNAVIIEPNTEKVSYTKLNKNIVASPKCKEIKPNKLEVKVKSFRTVENVDIKMIDTLERVEDIPNDLSTLSCNAVSDCLRLLNLQTYCKQSEYMKIDGKQFSNADEKFFKETLKMTPFDCSKIMRFLRGWRP